MGADGGAARAVRHARYSLAVAFVPFVAFIKYVACSTSVAFVVFHKRLVL